MDAHWARVFPVVLVSARLHTNGLRQVRWVVSTAFDPPLSNKPTPPFLFSCEPPQNGKKKKRRRKKKKGDDDNRGAGSGLATPGREKFTRGGGSHDEFFSQHNAGGIRAGGIDAPGGSGEKNVYQSKRSLERTRSARFYHAKGNTEAG